MQASLTFADGCFRTHAMPCEDERTRLIGELAALLREDGLPCEARQAGLTLIGWLARRMPGECPSQQGVEEMVMRAIARRDDGP